MGSIPKLQDRKENNTDFSKSNLRFLLNIVDQYLTAVDLQIKLKETSMALYQLQGPRAGSLRRCHFGRHIASELKTFEAPKTPKL